MTIKEFVKRAEDIIKSHLSREAKVYEVRVYGRSKRVLQWETDGDAVVTAADLMAICGDLDEYSLERVGGKRIIMTHEVTVGTWVDYEDEVRYTFDIALD